MGTDLDYAQVHQEGGTTKSRRLTPSLMGALRKWLAKQDKKVRDRMRWVVRPDNENRELEMEVPKRPFIGITEQTEDAISDILASHVMEAD